MRLLRVVHFIDMLFYFLDLLLIQVPVNDAFWPTRGAVRHIHAQLLDSPVAEPEPQVVYDPPQIVHLDVASACAVRTAESCPRRYF